MVPEPSHMAHNITTIAATDVEITITLITLIASTLFFIILIAAGRIFPRMNYFLGLVLHTNKKLACLF